MAKRPTIPTRPSGEPEFFSRQITGGRRFYLDLQPLASETPVVICGGGEQCDADYHMRRADFPFYALEFVARGSGKLVLAGKSHELVPGTLFTYAPGIGQDIRCTPGDPLVKYFVDFTGKSVRGQMKELGLSPGTVVQSSAPEHILQLFDTLLDAGLRRTRYTSAICSSILQHLLLRIAETTVAPGTIGTQAFATYQECKQYLEEHFLALSGLAELADACAVDPAYLCRLFSRFDHASPYQRLLQLKMSYAAGRLTQGLLVKQAAREVGFDDPFQFSRAFRRVLGVSPKRFLELQRA